MYYYVIVLLSYALHQVTLYSMYVSIMAFNAKVSDPLIGGTYMTLLNTVSNLGGNWPSTVALWLVDPLTVKECVGASNQNCRTPDAVELCKNLVALVLQHWMVIMWSLLFVFLLDLVGGFCLVQNLKVTG